MSHFISCDSRNARRHDDRNQTAIQNSLRDLGAGRSIIMDSEDVIIGGPFGCFLRGNVCRYDEALPLKEDYDMTIQQINRYRGVLRINKYWYNVKQSRQAGGCAAIRNFNKELEQLQLLQKKMGITDCPV